MGEGTTNLPPGFRFLPSDEELVVNFLYSKAALLPCQPNIIPTLDLNHCDPWELSGKALQGENQWYFFSRRTENRVSADGYWKPISVDEPVTSENKDVGMKNTLVYYVGEAPQGIKTNWVMQEYHLSDGFVSDSCSTSNSSNNGRRPSKKRGHLRIEFDKWVVCRVYEASCGSQASFHDNGTELSCLDEIFWSLDDFDEISLPNYD